MLPSVGTSAPCHLGEMSMGTGETQIMLGGLGNKKDRLKSRCSTTKHDNSLETAVRTKSYPFNREKLDEGTTTTFSSFICIPFGFLSC